MAKKNEVKIKSVNGGFLFEDFDIHVVAESENDAKAKVKRQFGIDVDKDTPPPKVKTPKKDEV